MTAFELTYKGHVVVWMDEVGQALNDFWLKGKELFDHNGFRENV